MDRQSTEKNDPAQREFSEAVNDIDQPSLRTRRRGVHDMNIEAAANYADVIGGIAVLISLIYVGVQIRGNTSVNQGIATQHTFFIDPGNLLVACRQFGDERAVCQVQPGRNVDDCRGRSHYTLDVGDDRTIPGVFHLE
jgi:hypothetical protein